MGSAAADAGGDRQLRHHLAYVMSAFPENHRQCLAGLMRDADPDMAMTMDLMHRARISKLSHPREVFERSIAHVDRGAYIPASYMPLHVALAQGDQEFHYRASVYTLSKHRLSAWYCADGVTRLFLEGFHRPVEIYSPERIQQYASSEGELAKHPQQRGLA